VSNTALFPRAAAQSTAPQSLSFAAAKKGHGLSEEALRCRFRGWQQKNGQDAQQ
jgi:hypothetical protein